MNSEYPDGTVDVKFLVSKTRVAPVKQQSMPRLELLGAVILARLSLAVSSTLPEQVQCYYWVDSMNVCSIRCTACTACLQLQLAMIYLQPQ